MLLIIMSEGTITKKINNNAKFPFSNFAFASLNLCYIVTIVTYVDAIKWLRLFEI